MLTTLTDINSGSFNADGVNRVGEATLELFAPLGATVEHLPTEPLELLDDDGQRQRRVLGNGLRLRLRPDAPVQVLLCVHLDTVFGADDPFQHTQRIDDDTLHGPGVADMKGGIVVAAQALGALESSPYAERIGWELLLTPDEEIGSPASAPLLTEAAARHHAGLVFEPAMADGYLAYKRRGSGNFTVVVRGRAAHAGREHQLGRNAIRALADFISGIDSLNGRRQGVTINPGFVHGGGPVNVVPDTALLRLNVRVGSDADAAWVDDQLQQFIGELNAREGISASLHGGFTRPPKPLTATNRAMFDQLREAAGTLGMPLAWRDTGGCCDGNNLAAAGLPNIDTLGPVGSGIHSAEERVRLGSITERARLTALLLLRWARGDAPVPGTADSRRGAQAC